MEDNTTFILPPTRTPLEIEESRVFSFPTLFLCPIMYEFSVVMLLLSTLLNGLSVNVLTAFSVPPTWVVFAYTMLLDPSIWLHVPEFFLLPLPSVWVASPFAVLFNPSAWEQSPNAVVFWPSVWEHSPSAVVLLPSAWEYFPVDVVRFPSEWEQSLVAFVLFPSAWELSPIAKLSVP